MKTWFTADCHFGHHNIIKYCNRPFNTVSEMDDYIIKSWNRDVVEDDIVWVLGDFCFGRTVEAVQRYTKRLTGRKGILMGDHDQRAQVLKQAGFEFVKDLLHFKDELLGRTCITCCHWPFDIWPKSHYNSWCLHGHCHGTHEEVGKIFDVGVDNTNFRLVPLEEIIEIMNSKPDNKNYLGNS